ncbi:MAG: hypothetical protein ABS98_09095 [Lysobacteraceae bacterium SCN 69-48]|nr:MAG: hypothetical protein ABS98_09095 [Xanthomonadaceae bacterium SCN 69-48]
MQRGKATMATTQSAQTRSAPSSETPLPTGFRKSAGAIQIWNSITLLQRKMFSVLLVNAYEELPNFGVVVHQIPLRVLAYLAGFNSNNTQYLKDALSEFVVKRLQWNIQRTDGRDGWAVSAALASARIEDGMLYYAFSPELRMRLYDPEVYAQLDLTVLREFKSSYGIALYENCKLFAGAGETPNFSLKDLRGMLGAGDNVAYETFSRFMDKVLKPATAEVNRISELQVEPVLTKEARRVTSIRFKIQDNGEKPSSNNPLQGRDTDLAMRIQTEIGLVFGHVLKLFEEHTDEHLQQVLDYVKERYLQGKVKGGKAKLPAYFVTTVKRAEPGSLAVQQTTLDLATAPAAPTEEQLAAAAADEARKRARKALVDVAQVQWDALEQEGRAALFEQFMDYLSGANELIFNSLRRSKAEPKPPSAAYRMLLNWLADRAQGEGHGR